MNTRIVVSMILLGFSTSALSLNASIKEKYLYTLITDDYGILNENDLASYTGRLPKTVPFSGTEKEFNRSYWQCFPRDQISVILEDTGSSPEDMYGTDTMADLKITACANPGIFHEYTVRAVMPTYAYEKTFHRWRTLMKNEPYVCLGGEFGERKNQIREDGFKQTIYTWTFDRIKTKKGCDSYFDGECEKT